MGTENTSFKLAGVFYYNNALWIESSNPIKGQGTYLLNTKIDNDSIPTDPEKIKESYIVHNIEKDYVLTLFKFAEWHRFVTSQNMENIEKDISDELDKSKYKIYKQVYIK